MTNTSSEIFKELIERRIHSKFPSLFVTYLIVSKIMSHYLFLNDDKCLFLGKRKREADPYVYAEGETTTQGKCRETSR